MWSSSAVATTVLLGALREVLSEEIFAACQLEAAIHLSEILPGYGSGLPPGT